MMIQRFTAAAFLSVSLLAPAVLGQQVVHDFEDLGEGPLGEPWTYHGLTFSELNNVSGVFPDGSRFDPEPTDEMICEDATLWYNDFPGWGSEDKLLTFGNAYVPGDNLSLGRLSTVKIDLSAPADRVAVDVGYYENGPWGGIVVHLDVLSGGQVVGSDSFEIANGGGRDNGAINFLEVSGAAFDQIHMYATFGSEYSLPRIILDDLTLDYIGGGARLVVDPSPLIAGQSGRFVVTGATPEAQTWLVYSLRGPGSTFVPFLNVTIDLAQPRQAGQAKRTDALGEVLWSLPIPGNARGRNVWFQAVQFENKTNVVATRVE